MKTIVRRSVMALAVLTFVGAASAQAETLQELIDTSGSIVSDGLLFDEFTYLGTGTMPPASSINVVPLVDVEGNFGLRFQGGFIDLPGGGASAALISYNVTVLDPAFSIVGANLAGNPIVTGASGFMGVGETFLPLDEFLEINAQNGSTEFTDETTFDTPQTSLAVQKNILGLAGEGSAVTLSFIDQTFVQVPEPAGIALLLSGAVGAVLITRRRRK